jgi:hypothetical protein
MKQLDKYFDEKTKEEFLNDLKENDCLKLVEDAGKYEPYLTGFEIRSFYAYNPKFGDDKECECGHPYYRHFDSYEDNYPCGCKYCGCREFKEK